MTSELNDDDASRLNAIRAFTQLQKDEVEAKENTILQKDRDDVDHLRGILKLVYFDEAELENVRNIDAITQYREDIKKLKQEIERADGRFRTTQRKLAEGTDKSAKSTLLHSARQDHAVTMSALRTQLETARRGFKEESKGHGLEVEKSATDAEIQSTVSEIRILQRKRAVRTDKQMVDREIALLYLSINNVKKGEQHLLQSTLDMHNTGTVDKDTVLLSTRDLYLLYLKQNRSDEALENIEKWMKLQIKGRLTVLEIVEKDLSQFERLPDPYFTTADDISCSVLVKQTLGRLCDLRLHVLEEILKFTPSDPYVLENIGNLYTRLRNYPKAHDILLKLMKSPHVQQLPLWSDVLRHQESFCKSNKARGRR